MIRKLAVTAPGMLSIKGLTIFNTINKADVYTEVQRRTVVVTVTDKFANNVDEMAAAL